MRRHLSISGRVQGVFYRDTFIAAAGALGLTGWVRNRRDGTVEAVIDGSERAIATMIEQAWAGSPGSHVTDVAIGASDEAESFDRLVRRPTL